MPVSQDESLYNDSKLQNLTHLHMKAKALSLAPLSETCQPFSQHMIGWLIWPNYAQD